MPFTKKEDLYVTLLNQRIVQAEKNRQQINRYDVAARMEAAGFISGLLVAKELYVTLKERDKHD